jgi:threonine synthase
MVAGVPGFLTHLQCPRCDSTFDAGQPANVCRCGSPLLARYDLDGVRAAVNPSDFARRPATLWRYRELLPVRDENAVVSLGEGWTPLIPAPRFGAAVGVPRLVIKDEGPLPTGSFKARGAAVGVSRAFELGVRHVAMPSNGNAAAAWAMYAARAGMAATVAMPVGAPTITRRECLAAGATLHLVDGLINDCGAMIRELVAQRGGEIFDVSTLKEPYRLEGKKTMGLELVEQLGWRTPDVIVYPTGGGVGLIGIYKGLLELRELGWLPDDRPLPRLVAAQAEGCAPVVNAFATGARRATPVANSHTIAFGINVPGPLGDELILDALYATDGTAVAVSDEQILADLRDFAGAEGLLLCPEGAACLSAVRSLARSGWLNPHDEVVVLNTGAGLKYPDTIPTGNLPILPAGAPLG